VVVLAAVEVHLGDDVRAVLLGDVDQQGDLDPVPLHERQRLEEVAAPRVLPRQGLVDLGEVGPERREQRAGHQLGDATAARGCGDVPEPQAGGRRRP
jgi:hypothetical protein